MTAGETPLLVACAGGAVRCVELLLSKGCDMDAVDSQGRGPLHHAVESGSYEAVMWVMEECRDVSPHDAAGITPLHIAIEHDYMDIGAPPPCVILFGMLS
jgi:ankyrin repeat protein